MKFEDIIIDYGHPELQEVGLRVRSLVGFRGQKLDVADGPDAANGHITEAAISICIPGKFWRIIDLKMLLARAREGEVDLRSVLILKVANLDLTLILIWQKHISEKDG